MVQIFRRPAIASAPASAPRLLLTVLAAVGTWGERRRQRRALSELNGHLLRDVGLSTADVWRETRKPFWRG